MSKRTWTGCCPPELLYSTVSTSLRLIPAANGGTEVGFHGRVVSEVMLRVRFEGDEKYMPLNTDTRVLRLFVMRFGTARSYNRDDPCCLFFDLSWSIGYVSMILRLRSSHDFDLARWFLHLRVFQVFQVFRILCCIRIHSQNSLRMWLRNSS
jgi:hypothetical protein